MPAPTTGPKRKKKSKSVLKRVRQTERRAAINRANKGHLRAQLKALRRALDAANLAQARQLIGPTLALLDSSIHKRLVHANAAARTKSRLMVRYNTLAQQGAPLGGAAAR